MTYLFDAEYVLCMCIVLYTIFDESFSMKD